ncbi:MAG: cytochrome c oxidase subunit 4, partial [Haloechinothrix sp.]
MKVEARLFDIVMVFAFFVAAVYGVATGLWTRDGVEPVGTVALILTGCLALLAGSYFRFISRRIEERPEDRNDAEISDGAGELGFFSPGSYWPFGLALSAALMGLALAFFYAWLI